MFTKANCSCVGCCMNETISRLESQLFALDVDPGGAAKYAPELLHRLKRLARSIDERVDKQWNHHG